LETKPIEIADRSVGRGHPCLIVAEAGVNHNGRVDLARRLIEAAAAAGADAVKFQTFRAERLAGPQAAKAAYQLRTTDASESQFEMLRGLELPLEGYPELMAVCRQRGLLFMSSPFDEESADFLDDLDMPLFKIPSGELTNLPFLAHVARKGKPLIISTGMSTLEEVEAAFDTVVREGNGQIILLHCTSGYPVDPEDANLRAMQTLAKTFGVPVGYSDHTLGIAVPLAAVALGACVIEKHFTLARALPGPDHQASAEPGELASLVHGIRSVEKALGHGRKEPVPSEAAVASVARKSLVAAKDIPAGTKITADLLVLRRPGTGLPPAMLTSVVGRRARRDIEAGTMLEWEMVS
jgi:N-acetylneuraminate synthase/N,N'-diacetyllegionaminate synthase